MVGFVFYLHLLANPIKMVSLVQFVPETMLLRGIGMGLWVLEEFAVWAFVLFGTTTGNRSLPITRAFRFVITFAEGLEQF